MARTRWTTVAIIGVAAVTITMLLWQPWLPRVEVGGVHINPHAKIDKAKSYTVVVWDYELPIMWSNTTHAQALQQAAAEFAKLYPNIKIELVMRRWDEDDGPLRDALETGTPPDVLGMPGGVRLVAPDYQVPLEHFLPEQEATDLFAAARRGATANHHLWGFPRWINPARWMLRTDRWPGGKTLAAPGVEPPALSKDEWEAGLTNARTKSGSSGLAVNVLDPSFFYNLMVAATGEPYLGSDGKVMWSEESIRNVASMLQDWVKRGFIPNDIESAARTRLARFWAGNTVALAPTNTWLIHHVLQRSGALASPEGDPASPAITAVKTARLEDVERNVVWTTPPQLGKNPAVAATVAGYAVFRQAQYQGNDHTQAAATVARFLSVRMDAWEAIRLFAVPAHPSVVPEWLANSRLPEPHQRALLSWSAVAVTPPVDAQLARLETRIMTETAVPNLVKVLKNQMTAEQFAQELTSTPTSAAIEVSVP